MQLSELENQVFNRHRVVTENGFEQIIPAELDVHQRGRVLTILQARTIIAALTGRSLNEVVVPPMFGPVQAAAPAEQIVTDAPPPGLKVVENVHPDTVNIDPATEAYNAAQSTDYHHSQLGRAA